MCYGFRNEYIIPILKEWCNEAHVEHCAFEYDSKSKTLIIHTNRPGHMIGFRGTLVDKYKQEFNKEIMCSTELIKFNEVDGVI